MSFTYALKYSIFLEILNIVSKYINLVICPICRSLKLANDTYSLEKLSCTFQSGRRRPPKTDFKVTRGWAKNRERNWKKQLVNDK